MKRCEETQQFTPAHSAQLEFKRPTSEISTSKSPLHLRVEVLMTLISALVAESHCKSRTTLALITPMPLYRQEIPAANQPVLNASWSDFP